MPPNKPQSNYSKRPVKRIRLLKIGPPRKTKSLFEEYFYGFVAAICMVVMILGKAGGLSGYEAIVVGLWAGGFTWSAWVLRRYRKEQTDGGSGEKFKQAAQTPAQMVNKPLPANMKPMIGPQWPVKTLPGTTRAWPAQRVVRPAPQESKKAAPTPTPATTSADTAPGAPNNPKKQAFVYERPTLPDRKPKLPNNWAGRQDKKPKR
jgi:hypothetical protein